MHKFIENIKTSYGKASTSLASESSDIITVAAFVDMENYDLYAAIAHVTNVASGETLTLRLWEATALATSDTDILVIQARAADLTAGYQFVGAKLSSSDTADGAEIVGIVQCQLRPRYSQATLA
jgi:hypothetical protein